MAKLSVEPSCRTSRCDQATVTVLSTFGFVTTCQLATKSLSVDKGSPIGSLKIERFLHTNLFPHLVLVKPDFVRILSEELIRVHTVDERRSTHSLLFSIHKHGHELCSATRVFCLLGPAQF